VKEYNSQLAEEAAEEGEEEKKDCGCCQSWYRSSKKLSLADEEAQENTTHTLFWILLSFQRI